MPILDDVRKALRVTTETFDDEIQDLIDACKEDLPGAGTDTVDETDPMVKRAIILYSRAHFGMGNPDMEKYIRQYDKIKNHLALDQRYTP